MESILPFFKDHSTYFLTFHILGTALGLGGATIADIMFFRFLSDYRISKKEIEVLGILRAVILGALLVIIITGFALYLPNSETYNQSGAFLVKSIGVLILTINGVALHLYVSPNLKHIDLKPGKKREKLQRLSFALGSISIISWYSVFFIAMLKKILPYTFGELLAIYIFLLLVGISGSQELYFHLRKKACE